jgi:hypothetical protein
LKHGHSGSLAHASLQLLSKLLWGLRLKPNVATMGLASHGGVVYLRKFRCS